MKKPIETSEDLINAIDDSIEKTLLDNLEEAQAYLTELGIDPVSLGKRLAERIKTLSDESSLNWRNQTEQIEEERNALGKLTDTLRGSADELKAQLKVMLGTSQQLALHHRNLNLEEMTASDLVQLLGELQFQQRLKPSDEDENPNVPSG